MKLENIFTNKKKSSQKHFISAIEGIGDILIYETSRRSKNAIIIESLNSIYEITENLFKIREQDPDKFDNIVFTKEFIDFHKSDQEGAQFSLGLRSEKHTITFTTIITQFSRIHDAANETKNNEICRNTVYKLINILNTISSKPGLDLFVEQVLRIIYDISVVSLKDDVSSKYAATSHWYTDTVFNSLFNEKKFDVSYLPLFNRCFFSTIQHMISNGYKSEYDNLVSMLIDGVSIPSYNNGKIWDFGRLLSRLDPEKYREISNTKEIGKKIALLANTKITSTENYNDWIKELNSLKSILSPNIPDHNIDEFNELEKDSIDYVESQLKLHDLITIAYATGSYCLFKKQYEFIMSLWEYKQPQDADATWTSHDLVPDTVPSIINFYWFSQNNKYKFWEGHHGSSLYNKQYFLLLLARAITKAPEYSDKNEFKVIYTLPDLSVRKAHSLQHSVDGLCKIAASLISNIEMLESLDFKIDEKETLFSKTLVNLLISIKNQANERIKKAHVEMEISTEMTDQFKIDVLSGYESNSILKDIFKHYKKYLPILSSKNTGNIERYGINQLADKEMFFDDWHVSYTGFGKNYGSILGNSESLRAFLEIKEKCVKINVNNFWGFLKRDENLDDLIILLAGYDAYTYFSNHEYFTPHWKIDSFTTSMKGFCGWITVHDKNVPIFKITKNHDQRGAILVRASTLGMWEQLSPINKNESNDDLCDSLYIKIQSYSNDSELKKNLILKSPDWLLEKGDNDKQNQYLDTKALINIYERYRYISREDFEGYDIILNDKVELLNPLKVDFQTKVPTSTESEVNGNISSTPQLPSPDKILPILAEEPENDKDKK
ncbi:MAG: hypothetical protein OEY66_11540 [Gammaproteobacteria bacterium]|nr:hypothetical protein [Gammaproteobacteria bacterium]